MIYDPEHDDPVEFKEESTFALSDDRWVDPRWVLHALIQAGAVRGSDYCGQPDRAN